MAVQDKYALSDLESGKHGNAAYLGLGKLVGGTAIIEVAAADDDLSVYRMFPGLDGSLIPFMFWLNNDAVTAGTDYDFGFYESRQSGTGDQGGAVVDKDKIHDGADMSSARAGGSELVLGNVGQLNIDELQEKIYTLGGHTFATRKAGYDLAWTANTAGTAAGTIVVRGLFLLG